MRCAPRGRRGHLPRPSASSCAIAAAPPFDPAWRYKQRQRSGNAQTVMVTCSEMRTDGTYCYWPKAGEVLLILIPALLAQGWRSVANSNTVRIHHVERAAAGVAACMAIQCHCRSVHEYVSIPELTGLILAGCDPRGSSSRAVGTQKYLHKRMNRLSTMRLLSFPRHLPVHTLSRQVSASPLSVQPQIQPRLRQVEYK